MADHNNDTFGETDAFDTGRDHRDFDRSIEQLL